MSSETREIVFFYNGQKYDDMDALREQAKRHVRPFLPLRI